MRKLSTLFLLLSLDEEYAMLVTTNKSKSSDMHLVEYYNDDWAGNCDDRKSTSGAQGRACRGTKTLLFSKLQVEEAQETSFEDLEASKTKKEEEPQQGSDDRREKRPQTYRRRVTIMYRMKNYQKKYEEYHEGYDHGAILMKDIILVLTAGMIVMKGGNEKEDTSKDKGAKMILLLLSLTLLVSALEFDRNSLQHVCTITSMRGRRHTIEFEGQGENVEGKLILCYGDLTMNVDVNLSFDLQEFNTFNCSSFGEFFICGPEIGYRQVATSAFVGCARDRKAIARSNHKSHG
ncbi:hypothetical protein M9H77_17055 [Catharanthus roseus]|uniref:Uncharacterized protein n=1 Tax=Catharanthus roseus TaxID=4058 RepID=A0ACC0B3I9_CATRO|nr:hypothetical protein M9H77_17055 [Catharanthus roseus]